VGHKIVDRPTLIVIWSHFPGIISSLDKVVFFFENEDVTRELANAGQRLKAKV